MCGRYSLYSSHSRIAAALGVSPPADADDGMPRYNIPPGTRPWIAAVESPEVRLEQAFWGFRPPWAGGDAPRPINARAEKVASSRYFAEAFAHDRCLIPADGWFEWHHGEAGKRPYCVRHRDGDLLMLAGIRTRDAESGQPCFAIITQPAVPGLDWLHDRMPVVLDPDCWQAWLNPERTSRAAVRSVARSLRADALDVYAVSERVNRPANDDPAVLEPATAASD